MGNRASAESAPGGATLKSVKSAALPDLAGVAHSPAVSDMTIPARTTALFAAMDADPALKAFVTECFEGLTPAALIDVHCHVLGVGTNGSGCYISDRMNQPLKHPINNIKKKVFLSSCGVKETDPDCDLKFAAILADLQRNSTSTLGGGYGKCHVLAFDQWYGEDGVANRALTGMYIPNQWVFQLCALFPDVFIPVASIHPYRADAVAELVSCHAQGARMIKWLPNSMGIDPSSPLCAPFYAKMKELNMILLTHTGQEHSVDVAWVDDTLGNPLLLRAPLDAGVKVIAAHCASEGTACLCGHEAKQLDDDVAEDHAAGEAKEGAEEQKGGEPASTAATAAGAVPTTAGSSLFSLLFGKQRGVNVPHSAQAGPLSRHPSFAGATAPAAAALSAAAAAAPSKPKDEKTAEVANFDLFLRLMDVKRYEGRLFGDISSVCAHRRVAVLETLINRQDLHHRLINGTDYPVPAAYVVIWSSQLRRKGLITQAQENHLNTIFKYNPMLFDLCLKRCMRSSTGKKFLDVLFHTHEIFADDQHSNVWLNGAGVHMPANGAPAAAAAAAAPATLPAVVEAEEK